MQNLSEAQIIINRRERYNNILFMVGGPGSGKTFARKNLIDTSDYKIRDVDEWGLQFKRLGELYDQFQKLPPCDIDKKTGRPIRTGKCNPYGKLVNLDLKNPEHTIDLYNFMAAMKIKEVSLNYILANAIPGRLPNLLFDVTRIPKYPLRNSLIQAGYKPQNIHVVWVITDKATAASRNINRPRVVDPNFLYRVHDATEKQMRRYIEDGFPPEIDGYVYVIFNRAGSVEFYPNSNLVKRFEYTIIKYPNRRECVNLDKLYSWLDEIHSGEEKELYANA